MKFKCMVFDLDGTIYLGDELINGANEVIDRAREVCNGNVLFLTFQTM